MNGFVGGFGLAGSNIVQFAFQHHLLDLGESVGEHAAFQMVVLV